MSNESSNANLVSIMDIKFINISRVDLLQRHLYPRLKGQEKCFVVTANPEIVMRTREDASYKAMVQSADYVVPDGAGVVIASKFINQSIKERIPGFDLMVDLLEYANAQGLSCYFLGARDHVNKKMRAEVAERHPNIKIAGFHHGFFSDGSVIAEDAAKSEPDIIFVALGSPGQETWITEHIDQFSKGLFIGVGGSFDVLAGEVKRAPDSWIKHNFEWLYRLLKEPFRWKRMLKSLEFMIRMLVKKE